MASLDLNAWLSLISTSAIVVALIFAGVQLREANRTRREQAAMACIQSAQDDSWIRAVDAVVRLPAGIGAEQVDAAGEWAATALSAFGVRLESIAYMVYVRMVSLKMVDELIGGIILVFWARAGRWVERERVRTGNPKLFEWCQWLAERIEERRAAGTHEPAHLKHRSWR